MKQFLLKTWLLLVCLLCGAGTMWAEEVVYKTALFGDSYNSQKVSSYSNSWTATNNGFTVNLANWNNNNNGWDYIKAGHKSTAYVGTITTAAAIDKAVTKIVVTIDAITADNVTSIKLYSGDAADACTTEIGSFDKSTGAKIVTISSPAANKFYKIAFDCIAKANGCVQVSKVEYYYDNAGGSDSNPVDASWSVDPTSVSIKAGKTATATITTNYDGTLSVSSANSSIATASIDGKVITVTGVAEGNTTLSVSGAATSTYNAIDKTISVTVTANDRPANEIFYESFDTNDGTGGNDDKWNGSIASNNIKQDNDGWVFGNGSGANECAKFGTSSKLGTATTPALGEACDATLTFKAAAWDGSSESTTLKLSVIGGGSVSPTTVTMTKGAWNDFEVTLTSLTVDSKVKFEGNVASSSRFFLDEVSVVKTGEATQKTLSYIVVKNKSNKYIYTEGEYFAPGGLTITATYSDNTTEDIHYSDHESAFTFSPALDEPLTVSNTTITITYGGVSTTQTITVEPLVDITNTQETAYTVAEAIALINAGKGLSTPVYVKGIVSKIVTEYSSSYGNISFNVSADGETTGDQFQFFHNFKGADKLKWTDEDTKPAVGDEVIGFGKLTKYSSTYEFAEGNYIVSLTHPAAKTKPELSFEPASCVATLGQPFTAPTLTNPEGVEVTYSSSAEDVANVDSETGAVTLVGAGTTTITATFTGNENYLEASARYTLVVEAATTPEPGDEVTFDFTTKTYGILVASNSNTNDYETTGKTISENGVSMEIACTKYRIWDGGSAKDLRFFSDGNPSWTITAPNGYTIIQIIHTGESVASISGNSGSISYTKPNNTWTGEAKSVTFTSSTNKATISTISVTLKESGTDPDVDPEPTTQYGELAFVATTGNGNYYATFSCDRDVIFDAENEAIEVQTVAVVDGSLLVEAVYNNSLSAVTDKTKDEGWITGYYVPANTGVLVYSIGNASAKYYYAEANQGNVREDVDADNMLVAACIPMAGDSKFYKLAYGDWTNKTKLGFWWGEENGAAFECKAGTAYLAVPNDDAAANSNMRGFSFEPDARPTGIESISNDVVAGEIYNLQGQRISRLQQGVNIVNGHKVIR